MHISPSLKTFSRVRFDYYRPNCPRSIRILNRLYGESTGFRRLAWRILLSFRLNSSLVFCLIVDVKVISL